MSRGIYYLPRCCGGVPEWPKGADCKSATKVSVVRIHLPPPLALFFIDQFFIYNYKNLFQDLSDISIQKLTL